MPVHKKIVYGMNDLFALKKNPRKRGAYSYIPTSEYSVGQSWGGKPN